MQFVSTYYISYFTKTCKKKLSFIIIICIFFKHNFFRNIINSFVININAFLTLQKIASYVKKNI